MLEFFAAHPLTASLLAVVLLLSVTYVLALWLDAYDRKQPLSPEELARLRREIDTLGPQEGA